MSIAYVPANLGWQPTERPAWSSGGFNLDKAAIQWRGPAIKREAFLAGLEALQWGSMPAYSFAGTEAWGAFPLMFLEDWNESNSSPSFSGQVLNYIGFKTQALPDAEYSDSTTTQVANGSGTYQGDTISGTFTYIASRTTWKWFDNVKPNRVKPRYATINQPLNPLQIISYSLRNSSGAVNSVSTAQFGAVFNSLTPVIRVTFDDQLLVPGKLWACSSTVDYILETS